MVQLARPFKIRYTSASATHSSQKCISGSMWVRIASIIPSFSPGLTAPVGADRVREANIRHRLCLASGEIHVCACVRVRAFVRVSSGGSIRNGEAWGGTAGSGRGLVTRFGSVLYQQPHQCSTANAQDRREQERSL